MPVPYQNPFAPVRQFNDTRVQVAIDDRIREERNARARDAMEANYQLRNKYANVAAGEDDVRQHAINQSIIGENEKLMGTISTLTSQLQPTEDEKMRIAQTAKKKGVEVDFVNGNPTFIGKDKDVAASYEEYDYGLKASQKAKLTDPKYAAIASQLQVATQQQQQLWQDFKNNPITAKWLMESGAQVPGMSPEEPVAEVDLGAEGAGRISKPGGGTPPPAGTPTPGVPGVPGVPAPVPQITSTPANPHGDLAAQVNPYPDISPEYWNSPPPDIRGKSFKDTWLGKMYATAVRPVPESHLRGGTTVYDGRDVVSFTPTGQEPRASDDIGEIKRQLMADAARLRIQTPTQ
jgi:hypothetical protein